MTKQQRIEGIPYAKVKEKAIQNRAVLAEYEKAKKNSQLMQTSAIYCNSMQFPPR